MKANVENMSPSQINDIKDEMRDRFPDVDWVDMSQERVHVLGYDFAIPGVLSNSILRTIDETHEHWENAYESQIPEHVAFCSDQYNFVPYEVAGKVFADFIDQYEGWGKPTYKFQILDNGRKMRGEALFNEHKDEILANAKVGDIISPIAGFQHSIDLSWLFKSYAGALNLACANGMVAHTLNLELGKKHKSTLDIGEMIYSLAPVFEKYEEQLGIWSYWGEQAIEAPVVEDLLNDSGFGTKQQEEILQLPETTTGETLEEWIRRGRINVWNMYNVLTQYTTHEIESDLVRVRRGEDIAKTFESRFRRAA
jgi:hypothetical protein